MAAIALLPVKAQAAFVFANPTGFDSQTSALSGYDFLGTGDLGVTVPFQGANIRETLENQPKPCENSALISG
jgi:hypothetical protein